MFLLLSLRYSVEFSMIDRYIQFGCGTQSPPGWLNFDVSPFLRLKKIPAVGQHIVARLSSFPSNVHYGYGDIVRGLPIPDGSVYAMYSSHVLEHLYLDECRLALKNSFRHLQSGGYFRLVVPDISKLATAYLGDPEEHAGMRFVGSLHMTVPEKPRTVMRLIRLIFGHSQHRWMWDFGGLASELRKAGFSEVREAQMNDSKVPEFSVLEIPERFEFAVCIEARK